MNKLKLRTKLEAVLIVAFLLAVGLSSVFAVTRTISDTGDTVYTRITCSNGNVYEATAANLQTAINSLNNQSGWVDGGKNNITLATTLLLGTRCELRNVQLYLGASVNKTMIWNYDTTNGNNGIYIHDVYMDGNAFGQPEWNASSTSSMWLAQNGIYLRKCQNVTICDVTVYNVGCGGVFLQQTKNSIVDRLRVFSAGYPGEIGATQYQQYEAGGLYLYNASDCTISNVIVKHTQSYGICIESTMTSLIAWRDHNIAVTNCYVSETTIAYYVEDASNITFMNCIAEDCSRKINAFALSMAFYGKTGTTNELTVIGCRAINCPNGLLIDANNVTIDDCYLEKITRYAMQLNGNDITVANCHIYKPGGYGIYINGGKRVILIGNRIFGAGNGYAGIMLSGTKNVTISANDITQSALHYPDYGIQESTTANRTYIGADNNINVVNEKIHLHGTYSWAMLVNITTGKIGIQSGAGTIWN